MPSRAVTINGSYCPTGRGVRAPDDTTAYGVWHYLAKNRLSGGVVAPARVGFSGTKVDDLLITASRVCRGAVGAVFDERGGLCVV